MFFALYFYSALCAKIFKGMVALLGVTLALKRAVICQKCIAVPLPHLVCVTFRIFFFVLCLLAFQFCCFEFVASSCQIISTTSFSFFTALLRSSSSTNKTPIIWGGFVFRIVSTQSARRCSTKPKRTPHLSCIISQRR